jgi:NADPH:quinone reductase-like Zn-dependent oxidoreductase
MPATMRAVVMPRFGDANVLEMARVPVPEPGPGEIRLKVEACGIDRHDLIVRAGVMRKKTGAYRGAFGGKQADIELPLILGCEFSGTVDALGEGVRSHAIGDRVAALPRMGHCGRCLYCRSGREETCPHAVFIGHDVAGAYAEYVIVKPDSLWPVPNGVSLTDASLGSACIGTIVRAIRDVGQVRVGERVLVTGAGGGLGVHAVQLVRAAGARCIAVTTTPAKAALLKELGAHDVLVVGREDNWSAEVAKVTNGEGADVAIDIVGSASFNSVLRSMAAYGRWVLVGELGRGQVELRPALIFLRRLQLLASGSPGLVHLAAALDYLASGAIRTVIDTVMPLERTAEAHALMEAGTPAGRIVLKP